MESKVFTAERNKDRIKSKLKINSVRGEGGGVIKFKFRLTFKYIERQKYIGR